MTAARASLIDDLVVANHILADQGIVDAFGHVSARHDADPTRFLLARNIAPSRVCEADILQYDVATGEAIGTDLPRLYLERFIHSEIYRARPDVMAVVHHHSPAVLPFAISRGARLRPVCHMAGFLGGSGHESLPLFEIREHAGAASDLLIRNRELGTALARTLGDRRVVLMRGHGATVVGGSLQVAVFRAIFTEVNAKLLLAATPLGGEIDALTDGEADATRETNEGQVARPWDLWREQARARRASA